MAKNLKDDLEMPHSAGVVDIHIRFDTKTGDMEFTWEDESGFVSEIPTYAFLGVLEMVKKSFIDNSEEDS